MLSIQKELSQVSDEQLLLRYRQTEDSALIGELYGRYYHLVFGTCLKFLKNKEESSDQVVVIFEKLIHKLKQEKVHNFNSWLYSLCKNECLSLLRKQKTQRNRRENWEEQEKKVEIFMENEDLLRLCEEEIAAVEEEEEDLEIKVKVAVRQLPREQRICIQLFFYKQMSYQQIAEMTKYSLLQVKSYLQNGKRNLKKLLQEET